ncbi:MAG TPA: Gfo/Idh/MocA family oxidoreductase [Alphaproteobacteria bacterium]|nr:Gfo/Idh/MocA family oxidoreductase [Alphaproteobacteria bacterium]
MTRVRIGVVGAGLIGQIEHIPNLQRLSAQYEITGIADASARMRAELERRGFRVFADYRRLLECELDAILVAAPDQYHADITLAALERGLNVFCEKPLCFSVKEAKEIAKARDRTGKVVQVGYMKRFDPSYEMLRDLLPKDGTGLRFISVEVQDPDSWPFNQHQGNFVKTDDISGELIEDARTRREQQVRQATGRVLTGPEMWGFTNSYCSSLIHDINAVHGLLDVMGLETGSVIGAAFFASGDGGHGSIRLKGCDAIWQMTHLFVPKVADYRERISLYFDDAVFELTFPSPYLNHFPTHLTIARSEGSTWRKTEYRASFEEAFVRELNGFWMSVTKGEPVRNTVEAAERDLQLAAQLAEAALRK